MATEEILFTVIIPHWNSTKSLTKLLDTIPCQPSIEIIVVDNSPVPIRRDEIDSDRNFKLLYSSPERGAGGARNAGIVVSRGKWLVFADADDFFAPKAFDILLSFKDTTADVIFFMVDGVYSDTNEHANRADGYAKKIRDYKRGSLSEDVMRYTWGVPWGKMIRKSIVDANGLRFDEIVASNDIYFSTLCGYYAEKIEVSDELIYIVTVSRGSLTRRRDYPVIKSRLYAKLHCNSFLKKHELSKFQWSIMYFLKESLRFGFVPFFECIRMIIKFKQNPFIGCGNWIKTSAASSKLDKKEKKYIVK